jgi:hypothetical protein
MKTYCSEQKSHRALKLKSHFAASALGDSICFGIFVVYQFHPGTLSLNNTLIGFGPKQAITTQSEMNSLHV